MVILSSLLERHESGFGALVTIASIHLVVPGHFSRLKNGSFAAPLSNVMPDSQPVASAA